MSSGRAARKESSLVVILMPKQQSWEPQIREDKGKTVIELAAASSLILLNEGELLSFRSRQYQSIFDLTFLSEYLAGYISS